MALQTKTFEGTAGSSYWRYTVEVIEESINYANNTSSIIANVWLGRTGSSSEMYGASLSGSVTIGGTRKTFSYSYSGRVQVAVGQKVLKIGTCTFTIAHDDDGDKTVSITSSMTNNVAPVSGTLTSQPMTLTSIPRYASVTISATSRTETSITIKWTTDASIDRLYVSTDNGDTWSDFYSASGTSGTRTISGLTVKTPYNIRLKVRRKDSGLETTSSRISVSTYNFPNATSTPDFVIGNNVKIGIYNPLGREVTVRLLDKNGTEVGNITTSGTSVTGFSDCADDLYDSISDALEATYRVRCSTVVSGTTHNLNTTGGTYSVNENTNKPVIGAVAYRDTNQSTINVTGNNQYIIQNRSRVFVSASGLTAKNGATIASAKFVYTGESDPQNMTVSGSSATATQNKLFGANSVKVTVTVTDSRGLTASKSINVNMVPYTPPVVTISLYRENSYYDQSYLKVTGSISPITVDSVQRNSIESLTYKNKDASASSYGSEVSITSGTQYTLVLANTSAWDFVVSISDKLESVEFSAQLPKGIPLIMFDRLRNSVGVNILPEHNDSFEVGGYIYANRIYTSDPEVLDGSPSSAVSIPSGSATNVASISLDVGTYLVIANLAFASNATGRRSLYIGTSTANAVYARVTVAPASGILTSLNASAIVTRTSAGTVYLNAEQNSGAALNTNTTYTSFFAIRIA